MNILPKSFTKSLSYLLFFFVPILFPVAFPQAQAIWQKYPSNPIFSENTSNWDSYHVHNPHILKINNTYNMWYDANGGSGWRIGFALSPDGINNWSRSASPVVPPGTQDGLETEMGEPSVLLTPTNSYKIWYNAINSGPITFGTRYGESNDGFSWTKIGGLIFTGSANSWDSGGILRGKSILLINGTYHQWYAGENVTALNNSWRIGYATSTDGINWTKQNNGNPVITPSESWELNNASYPTVLLLNEIYHMWYGAGTGDLPTQIVYAYSTDGINWIKPANLNPALTLSPGLFDSQYIAPYTVLKEDTLKMWYSGFDGTHWRIGYATADAAILPTPSVTPTPTPTPTPTATPTPTPPPTPSPTATPTPTPIPSTKKVVVVPGVAGSWNDDALMNCKLNNYSGNWTSWVGADPIYNPLIQALTAAGYTPVPFYYDWRKPITSNVAGLKSLIDAQGEKVNLVGHSMGGLVSRAYVEQEKTNQKTNKLLTVGSPHQGSLQAYYAWSDGKIVGDIKWQVISALLINRCRQINKWSPTQAIHNAIPSIQNLLPTFSYIQKTKTGAMVDVTTMHAQNNWQPTSFAPPFFGATVGSIAGTGFDTLKWLVVKDPTKPEIAQAEWQDGKPVQDIYNTQGDETVLTSSAILAGTAQQTIHQTHGGVVASSEGTNAILSFLNGASSTVQATSMYVEPTSALFIASYPSIFWVEDPSGKTVQGNRSQMTYLNPKKGAYKLRIIPTSTSTLVVVVQVLPNGKTLYKEYTLGNILPKFKSVLFDPQNPAEDSLK